MPPLIATLATNFILVSIAIAFSKGLFIKPPHALEVFVNTRIVSVPSLMVLVLAFAILSGMALKYTPYGRSLMAIGQNEKAAWLSGIRPANIRCFTYLICSCLACVTGVLLAAFSGGASLEMGSEYLLTSVAVVVLGGTKISGGKGNVQGIVGAALFLFLITALLNILGSKIGIRQMVTGLVIILVIYVANARTRLT
jgi:ribose transport system permease protein